MDIREATQRYETWLGGQIPLIPADLEMKHQRMAESAFAFLRATFYRWVQLFPEICPELFQAPQVLAVGDLHVENFGTWRDAEGRLVWGVNDFDEAYPLAYTNDLVRLAASAILAIHENLLAVNLERACEGLLTGYIQAMENEGSPFVLAERHTHLRDAALGKLRDPLAYWQKLDALPSVEEAIPETVRRSLEQALPDVSLEYRAVHRQAGLGSLGHERYTVIAEWRGGKIAREAKRLVESAAAWEKDKPGDKIYYAKLIGQAVHVPDPFVSIQGDWVIRRLAPDCSRIELTDLPKERDEDRLLHSMGWETANQHLGSQEAVPAILADLKKRKDGWLFEAAESMAKATQKDWEDWKRGVS